LDKNSKLLIWTDAYLLHYCLASSLQKKSGYDIYGIFDVPNKLKPFFETQKLVNYKKKWFFHDHISPKKNPDLEYLRRFENNYGLKLWTLAINERIFLNYNPFYKFNKNEILSILESECKLFEEILDDVNPDYLLTLDFGLHHSHLFVEMCRKKSIPILMLNVSKFPNQCYISQSFHTLDEEPNPNDDQNFSFEDLQKLLTKNNLGKKLDNYISGNQSKLKTLQAGLNVFMRQNSNINTHFTYYGRTKQKLFLFKFKMFPEVKKRKNFLDKNAYKTISNENFIYSPLSVEPERTLLIDTPYFTNQIETVYHIAKSIPIDYTLYVKEHPTQGPLRGWRPISDYKKIIELPNVKLIHPEVSSTELIKKSSLVITAGGTSSFEAQIYNKPSLFFANFGYQKMGNIEKVNSLEELPKKIQSSLNSKVDLKKMSIYVSSLLKNSFNFDYFGFYTRSGKAFFYDEHLVDTKISENDMEKFLIAEESNLDLLASEHVKKIQSYKT